MKYGITKKMIKEILGNQRVKTEIILQCLLWNYKIAINDREWRSVVREYNNQYGKSGLYIASNRNGYLLTTKSNEIKKSAFAKFNNGLSMIRNAKATLKELEDNNQLKLLNDNETDIYRAVCSFKEK